MRALVELALISGGVIHVAKVVTSDADDLQRLDPSADVVHC